jgi:hypothetical protein
VEFAENAFRQLDVNSDGVLTLNEVQSVMIDLMGVELSNKDLEHLCKSMDQNNDGNIDIGEFLAVVNQAKKKFRTTRIREKKADAMAVVGSSPLMLLPLSNCALTWDAIVTVNLLAIMIAMPLQLAFQPVEEALDVWNKFLDVMFMLDLIKQFNCGSSALHGHALALRRCLPTLLLFYYCLRELAPLSPFETMPFLSLFPVCPGIVDHDARTVIIDRKIVGFSYLTSWFTVDLISSAPVSFIQQPNAEAADEVCVGGGARRAGGGGGHNNNSRPASRPLTALQRLSNGSPTALSTGRGARGEGAEGAAAAARGKGSQDHAEGWPHAEAHPEPVPGRN